MSWCCAFALADFAAEKGNKNESFAAFPPSWLENKHYLWQGQLMTQAVSPGVQGEPRRRFGKVVELLRPGTFVLLADHPDDLPPFQLIRCKGGRCWVRQQAWGGFVFLEVDHHRLTGLDSANSVA